MREGWGVRDFVKIKVILNVFQDVFRNHISRYVKVSQIRSNWSKI